MNTAPSTSICATGRASHQPPSLHRQPQPQLEDGLGLSELELARMFQPFYRTAAARAWQQKGNGHGMAVCRFIARAHGGDVELSDGETGLMARVRLQMAWVAVRAQARRAASKPGQATAPARQSVAAAA